MIKVVRLNSFNSGVCRQEHLKHSKHCPFLSLPDPSHITVEEAMKLNRDRYRTMFVSIALMAVHSECVKLLVRELKIETFWTLKQAFYFNYGWQVKWNHKTFQYESLRNISIQMMRMLMWNQGIKTFRRPVIMLEEVCKKLTMPSSPWKHPIHLF